MLLYQSKNYYLISKNNFNKYVYKSNTHPYWTSCFQCVECHSLSWVCVSEAHPGKLVMQELTMDYFEEISKMEDNRKENLCAMCIQRPFSFKDLQTRTSYRIPWIFILILWMSSLLAFSTAQNIVRTASYNLAVKPEQNIHRNTMNTRNTSVELLQPGMWVHSGFLFSSCILSNTLFICFLEKMFFIYLLNTLFFDWMVNNWLINLISNFHCC